MSEPRDHLALALDVGGFDTARPLARRLSPWFAIVKVGYELYAEVGPTVFDAFHEDGFAVFADLKFLDIPTTVERGARALGRRGVDFLNFHAVGGEEMLRAGVDGLAAGARDAGHDPPVALAVTVLTSEPDASAVPERLRAAQRAGCDGVVCAAGEAGGARDLGLARSSPGCDSTSPMCKIRRGSRPRRGVPGRRRVARHRPDRDRRARPRARRGPGRRRRRRRTGRPRVPQPAAEPVAMLPGAQPPAEVADVTAACPQPRPAPRRAREGSRGATPAGGGEGRAQSGAALDLRAVRTQRT